MPVRGARAGRPVRGRQRRGQDLRHDRLAGRLDDRAARRDQGGHQPPVPRHAPTCATWPSGPRWPRSSGDLGGRGHDAERLRPAPARPWCRCSTTSRASAASSRRGRSTPSRASRRCSAGRSPGRVPRTTLELAEILLDEARVAIVPGEAFGAPGYARLSYALGDDDLVEGVTRHRQAAGGRLTEPVDEQRRPRPSPTGLPPRPGPRRRRRRPRPAASGRRPSGTARGGAQPAGRSASAAARPSPARCPASGGPRPSSAAQQLGVRLVPPGRRQLARWRGG